MLNLNILIFWVYFLRKKDIGIGILKSIKNKIIIFKLFQERPPLKINQWRESSAIQDLWKFCSFYNNLCSWKKYLKLLTIRIQKFWNHQSIGDRFSKKEDTRTTSGANKIIDLPLIKLTAKLALPIVSSTIQYKSQYMGTLPWKGGGYQWRALRYKCLRLIHSIQASVKRRLKNYMMFLSVYRSFFVEADNCRLVLRNYLSKAYEYGWWSPLLKWHGL